MRLISPNPNPNPHPNPNPKTEREVLRKTVKIVIPQMSKLEIFNQKLFDEELSTIS